MEPLIVAAHSSELTGISGEIVGVGLVEAALGAAHVLGTLCRPSCPPCVLLLGSCGAYPGSGLAIGDIVSARACVLACAATAEGRAGLPEPIPRRVEVLGLPDHRTAVVATTVGITTDDALAAALAREAGADVENLEAFSVARACARASVPFAALLGVTNLVGAGGREQWRANRTEVAERVCGAARELLSNPARARWLRSPTTPRSPA
jgi:futalosine hydrolase